MNANIKCLLLATLLSLSGTTFARELQCPDMISLTGSVGALSNMTWEVVNAHSPQEGAVSCSYFATKDTSASFVLDWHIKKDSLTGVGWQNSGPNKMKCVVTGEAGTKERINEIHKQCRIELK